MTDKKDVIRKLDEKIVERAMDYVRTSPAEYVPGIIDPTVKPFLNEDTVKPSESKKSSKKKKRAPSKYNIFIGDCMRAGNDMKTCADKYKANKNEKKDESTGIQENQNIITLLTQEGCPMCERIEESLAPLIEEGVITSIEVGDKPEYDSVETVPAAIIDEKICDVKIKEDGIHFICPGEDDMVVSLE